MALLSPVPALPELEPKTPTMYVTSGRGSGGFVKARWPVWTQMERGGWRNTPKGRIDVPKGATNCTCLPMLQVLRIEATRHPDTCIYGRRGRMMWKAPTT